jgi:flagellar motor switch protein FliM
MAALVAGTMPSVERLPGLQLVIDRFAQHMTTSLRTMSGVSAEISIEPPRAVRSGEFLATLPTPTMAAVMRIEPWDGACLAVLDAALTGATIDLLLGGRRSPPQSAEGAARPWTAIERAVVERLVADVLARDLARAFEPIAAVDCLLERMETAPGNAAIAKPGAPAVAFRVQVDIADVRGCVDFMIPMATLEPAKGRLAREVSDRKPGGDAAWHTHLQAELPHTTVKLRAVVEFRRISTSEVMRWRVGSHLPLNRRHDEPIDLLCGDLPVLHARIAEKSGRIALHIEQRRLAEDWPIPT